MGNYRYDYATAKQVLSLRHGRYTIPVMDDSGTIASVDLCSCGAYWPCPVGVLLEGYTALQDAYLGLTRQHHQLVDKYRELLVAVLGIPTPSDDLRREIASCLAHQEDERDATATGRSR